MGRRMMIMIRLGMVMEMLMMTYEDARNGEEKGDGERESEDEDSVRARMRVRNIDED